MRVAVFQTNTRFSIRCDWGIESTANTSKELDSLLPDLDVRVAR